MAANEASGKVAGMKILLAIDGSPCSQAALDEVSARPWPAGSELKILSVAYTGVPEPAEVALLGGGSYQSVIDGHLHRAEYWAQEAWNTLRSRGVEMKLSKEILEGPPKHVICEEAERWGADLILLGSHGYGPAKRFLLGSISHAVALHAPCSVEIVRARKNQSAR
jgi:nucleotide-binding universal stress UspA family protein